MDKTCVMAIDVGLKRIGVALSFDGSLVFPQPCVFRKNREQASMDVLKLTHKWKVERLVVGLPKDGQSSEEMARRIHHFVGLVGFEGEVIYVDEQGSSVEAKERMRGVTKQERDGKIDSLAALIILERYLAQCRKD
ncbi:Holliday junction resolvase RuvX [Sulfurospirillum sp. T05]|uniref:Putative pre-16S rRNA nuclease n=1 Tax=Sulfurospirillum tamanense TaxID=2813362 RepID=A0ABS2WQ22_9BACT|nr:Holliday junction resolvase RuvX [Sulfurospirillum tamanensis]MBN2963792.1 Holliday junction resolvase RuvX [Sulfurospirillum tamanensis]